MGSLISVLVDLTHDGREGAFTGHHVQSWFLDVVRSADPVLSTVLHEPTRRKPFTLWAGPQFEMTPHGPVVRPGERRHWLRITTLHPSLDGMVRRLAETADVVPLGGCRFTPTAIAVNRDVQPWADCDSFVRMRDRYASASALTGRVRLRFLSPTAFSGTNGNALFPLGGLVFRSLIERWNLYADIPIAGDIQQELRAIVREEAHDVRTAPPLAFGKFTVKGFVGTCEYSLGPRPSDAARRALHLLADCSFYAGVGLKTTMGMGQVICERQ